MPVAPKSMQDMEELGFASDPVAIRDQLQKLLTHPLFSNSKRYPALPCWRTQWSRPYWEMLRS
jgi:hypothetical protein